MSQIQILAALIIACIQVSVANGQATSVVTSSSATPDGRWSKEQKEVWGEEQNYARFLEARNLKGFMSLWHESFVGWPDYSEYPVGKPQIESSVAEEFQSSTTTPNLPVPPLRAESVAVFGDVAVTHYFWPESDPTSPTKFRVTHTWRKGSEGWRIISGMSCAVTRSNQSGPSVVAATPNQAASGASTESPSGDTFSVESIIDTSLQALGGPAGKARDWKRYRVLFDPSAQLISVSVLEKGETTVTRWNVDTYQKEADDYLVKTGFEDRKLACLTTRFGNIASARCGFEGLEEGKVVERGVAMYQLYHDGKRWWISSIIWDRERPANPIPSDLLAK